VVFAALLQAWTPILSVLQRGVCACVLVSNHHHNHHRFDDKKIKRYKNVDIHILHHRFTFLKDDLCKFCVASCTRIASYRIASYRISNTISRTVVKSNRNKTENYLKVLFTFSFERS
jgi:hypothetical protein